MPAIANALVAIVGSLNLDLVATLPRLPASGETVGDGRFAQHPGGKGGNQAVAVARMGVPVAMFGRVGADSHGETLIAALRAEGIDTRIAIDPAAVTGVALIAVDAAGANLIAVCPGANDQLCADDLDSDLLRRTGVLLIQFETPVAVSQAAAALARSGGGRVVLNPAPARPIDPGLAGLVDWLVPNESEAARLLGTTLDTIISEPATAARALASHTRIPGILLTLGATGALLWHQGQALAMPAPKVRVIDTVAAGDALIGAFAACLAEGAAPAEALKAGVAAGSLACTVEGAQPALPRRAAVDALARMVSGR